MIAGLELQEGAFTIFAPTDEVIHSLNPDSVRAKAGENLKPLNWITLSTCNGLSIYMTGPAVKYFIYTINQKKKKNLENYRRRAVRTIASVYI